MARQEMYFQEFFTVNQLIEWIEAVDAASVQRMARRLFVPGKIAVTLLGRIGKVKLSQEMLEC